MPPAAKLLSGVLIDHGLVGVEVCAEPASDFAAAAQRCSPRDVAVSKLAQAHAVADQFRDVVDVHADQLRASMDGDAQFTMSSSGTRVPVWLRQLCHTRSGGYCAAASQAALPTNSSLTSGFADPHTRIPVPTQPHPLGKAATRS